MRLGKTGGLVLLRICAKVGFLGIRGGPHFHITYTSRRREARLCGLQDVVTCHSTDMCPVILP